MIQYPPTSPDYDYLDALDADRYEPMAPCPHCFESSGYAARVHPHTWYEAAWADADPTRPCPFCNGTGDVPCDLAGPDDERADDFEDDGYERSVDEQARARLE